MIHSKIVMKTRQLFIILPCIISLTACGEGTKEQGKKIEKKAEESADKAADKSLEKLNRSPSKKDSAEADSTEG